MSMKKNTIAAITAVTLLSFSLGGQIFAAGSSFKDIGSISGKDQINALKGKRASLKGSRIRSFFREQ